MKGFWGTIRVGKPSSGQCRVPRASASSIRED